MSPDGRESPPPAVDATLAEVLNERLEVPRGARGAPRSAAHDPRAGRLQPRAVQVGHVDRPQQVHGLQRLRRRLPVGEQHPRRRQGERAQGPPHAVDPHRPLLHGADRRSRGHQPAARLRAVRDGALRVRLPRQRDHAQRRGPQRDGLQPLHRHALLQQQLPVQGAALQLPQLHERLHGRAHDGDEPRRHGAHARRHGEVHLLRAAHRAQAHRRRASPARRSRTASSRRPASRAARRAPSSSARSTIRTPR